ncbi:aminotransferase class III, partial [bacterium]|nr:aminotransferase class III [bacterium]
NGYPIAAVIGTTTVMEAAQTSFISSTNWTERVGPAAAIATINKHRKENVAKHLVQLGQKVQQGWSESAAKHGLAIHVGGIKPLSHFSFEGEHNEVLKAYFIQLMLAQGFLASNQYYAMYAHTEDHVLAYLKALDIVFAELASGLAKGDLLEKLDGKAAQTGFQRLN